MCLSKLVDCCMTFIELQSLWRETVALGVVCYAMLLVSPLFALVHLREEGVMERGDGHHIGKLWGLQTQVPCILSISFSPYMGIGIILLTKFRPKK